MKIRDKRREEIVAEYLAGEVTYREMETRYGISSSTMQRWVKEWGTGSKTEESEGLVIEEGDEGAGSEIKRLRSELRRAELHNKLLNAMIDIAEEQMGIKIRKKPGAGQ